MAAFNLLGLFNNPPLIPTQSVGKQAGPYARSTVDCAEPHQDRRIASMCDVNRDYQMCYGLLSSVRAYIYACNEDIAFENPIYAVHHATDRAMSRARLGDETCDADAFALIANYAYEFVAAADNEVGGLGIRTSCCPGIDDGSACAIATVNTPRCRVIRRNGKPRVHVQIMSQDRFDMLWEDIWGGAVMIGGGIEEDYNYIITSFGRCIMNTNCPWAIILAGSRYLVFHLRDVMAQGECVRRLTISDRHAISSAPLGPCLASVLIAQLLLADETVRNIPSSIACHEDSVLRDQDSMKERIGGVQRSRSPSPVPSRASSSSGTVKSETNMGTRAGPPDMNLLAVFNRISYCKMVSARSWFLDRSSLLTRVTSENVLEGALNLLHTAVLDQHQHQYAVLEVIEPPQRTCYNVDSGWFIVDGREMPCSIKIEQSNEMEGFLPFQNQVNVYERLRGHNFMPTFYAAFATMTLMGAMGVLVTEMAPGIFASYDGMNADEKHAVFNCAKQLHRAGYHNDYYRSEIFGVRDNGEIIIVDFAEAIPIDEDGIHSRGDFTCHAIRSLRKKLFGTAEMMEWEREGGGIRARREG